MGKDVYKRQVSYYKTRINFEVFHALTDGTGAMLFLKELVSNYLILCHPEEIFSKVSEDMLTETDFEEDSFSQYYTGKKSEKEKSRPAYPVSYTHLPRCNGCAQHQGADGSVKAV